MTTLNDREHTDSSEHTGRGAPVEDEHGRTGPSVRQLHVGLDQLSDPCTSAELATILGKSPKTIVDWCQERRYTHLPCFRLGNRWYHPLAELKRWLKGIKSGQIEFRRKPRVSAERR